MTEQLHGTVAVLELKPCLSHSFEDIVEEFDLAFRPPSLTRQTLTRDGDDAAIIERGPIRIVLGWLEGQQIGHPHYLVIGIGPTDTDEGIILDAETNRLIKAKLLMHAEEYLPVISVLHKDATGPIETDLIDSISDLLLYSGYTHEEDLVATKEPASDTAQTNSAHKMDPAYTVHAKSKDIIDAEFETLYDPSDSVLPQRLTVYAVGATMLIVSPPVGATFLTYATLKGLMEPAPPRKLN